MDLWLFAEILASTIRVSVPLVLACLAGLWSEKSGVVDIGLEGKMLAAAFAAAAAASYFQSAWVGLFFAILVSLAVSLLHGYASINQRGNQVVSGVAINMLAAGLTVVLGNTWYKEGGRTPALSEAARFMPIELPGAAALSHVPVISALVTIVSGHSILTYATVLLVPLTAWALANTRFGLRLRAVGENPHAVDTAGISVARLPYPAVLLPAILWRLCGAAIPLVPAPLLGLIGAHMLRLVDQKRTQWPGPGRTEKNVVGYPMLPVYAAKAGGFFFVVFGFTALMGAVLQINPIWYGILLTINLELALITPPVGMNLFAIKAISRAPIREIIVGVGPYVGLLLLGLALVIAFPPIALGLPGTMNYK